MKENMKNILFLAAGLVVGAIGTIGVLKSCKCDENRPVVNPSEIVYSTDEFSMPLYSFPTHDNLLIMDRAYAEGAEAILVRIAPDKFTHRHAHNDTEQLYYVLSGSGKIVLERPSGESEIYYIKPTDFVHIPRNNYHQVFCDGADSLKYVAIDCFTFGHNEKEPTWDSHARVVCADNGYDYASVRRR